MTDQKTTDRVDAVDAAGLQSYLEEYIAVGKALKELEWIDGAQQPKLPHVEFSMPIVFTGATRERHMDPRVGSGAFRGGVAAKPFTVNVSAPAVLAAVRERHGQIRAFVRHRFGVDLA